MNRFQNLVCNCVYQPSKLHLPKTIPRNPSWLTFPTKIMTHRYPSWYHPVGRNHFYIDHTRQYISPNVSQVLCSKTSEESTQSHAPRESVEGRTVLDLKLKPDDASPESSPQVKVNNTPRKKLKGGGKNCPKNKSKMQKKKVSTQLSKNDGKSLRLYKKIFQKQNRKRKSAQVGFGNLG